MQNSNTPKTEPPEPEQSAARGDGDAAVPEEDFGARLKSLREGKGLKHDALSELTRIADPQKRGIARTTLRGYEHGIYKPGIRELRVLSQALGVSPTSLIFGSEVDLFVPPHAPHSSEEVRAGRVRVKREFVHEWITFAVLMHHLERREHQALFALAHTLAEGKLGSVEYRRKMGVTSEIVDTLLDAMADWPVSANGWPTPDPAAIAMVQPLIDAILKKAGMAPKSQPETKSSAG